MTKFSACVLAVCLFLCAVNTYAQSVPFDPERWEIRAEESRVTDNLGRKSLLLKGGVAAVKDSQFTDGVIEFDISFTEERGFMGTVWRMQDFENYEEFYIRPHQSGQPDANQYQPVFNGMAAWQLYYGEGYAVPVRYDFNQWFHVKVVVSGQNAEIYIKDMEKPVLLVNELKRGTRSGRVGLSAGNFAPAHFSNFSYNALNSPALKGQAKSPEPAPAGTVMSWQISSALEGKSLEKKYQLTSTEKEKLTWSRFNCEHNGTANLGRLQGLREGRNTVFARLTIQSESDQIKKIRFGFSDSVRVYFNDQLLFGGSDVYRSRDHRFLGTIGLFDELYLPLKKGDNELWLAITENFGGWGVKALIEDMSGISLKN